MQHFDTINVNIGILLSQLGWYKTISDITEFESQQKKDNWINEIDRIKKSDFQKALKSLAQSKSVKKHAPVIVDPQPVVSMGNIPEVLEGNSWLTASQLRDKYKRNKTEKNIYDRAQAMASALDAVNKLRIAPVKGLSIKQVQTIKKYNSVRTDDTYLPILQREQQSGRLSSFSQLWSLIGNW